MSKANGIPGPAVRRLSLYLRELEALVAQGKRTVSSRELGGALGLTDAQVRKDLTCFGQFGHAGIGYRVDELILSVRRILGTDKSWNVLLVGAGNLGRALSSYRGFNKKAFNIVAVFDNDKRMIGTTIDAGSKLVVQPMDELAPTIRKRNIKLGILAIPADAAQIVADELYSAGIKGILNFAPVVLRNAGVAVTDVDLAVHLEQLSFQVAGSEH